MITQIEKRFIDMHPGSATRHQKASDIFPDGVTHESRRQHPFQLYYTHAEGSHKYDVDGNRIIDYWSGHGSLILGHSHPSVIEAVVNQMGKGTHLGGSTDLEMNWANHVIDLIPCAEKVRFHSSGAEATMMAIRMARAYTGKSKIVKFQNHFHGWSDYLVAGNNGTGGIPQQTLDTMIVLQPNDIGIVESALEKDTDIAAIIIEPTGAHMGLEPVSPSFLSDLRSLTLEKEIVLIFDEVVTGFRVSKGGAQEYYGITPDLTTLAKILGGGLPGGAVTGKSEIINMLETTDDPDHNNSRRIAHNGTFNANPISASAGITALGILKSEPINERATGMGTRLKKELNRLLTKLEIPGCASGVSSLIHLRLGVDHTCDGEVCMANSNTPSDINQNAQLNLALQNNGIHSGNRFIVSSQHSEQDIDDTIIAMEKSLLEVRDQELI